MKFDKWWDEFSGVISVAGKKQLKILFLDAYREGYEDCFQKQDDSADKSNLCQYDGNMVKCPFLTEGGG